MLYYIMLYYIKMKFILGNQFFITLQFTRLDVSVYELCFVETKSFELKTVKVYRINVMLWALFEHIKLISSWPITDLFR